MQNPWVFLVLVSVFLGTAREFIRKYSIHRVGILPFLTYYYIAAFSTVFLLSTVVYHHNPVVSLRQHWLVYLVSFARAAGVVALNKAIKINMSKSIVASEYSSLVTIVLAVIFLKEYELFSWQTTGGRLNTGGLVLFLIFITLSIEKKSEENKRWAFYRLMSLLILGVTQFFVKFLIDHNVYPDVILANEYFFTLIIVFTMAIWLKRPLTVGKKARSGIFLAGLFTGLAILAYYLALGLAPAAKVIPLRTVLGIITMTPIGYLFFNERHTMSKKEKYALIVGIIGMFLLVY